MRVTSPNVSVSAYEDLSCTTTCHPHLTGSRVRKPSQGAQEQVSEAEEESVTQAEKANGNVPSVCCGLALIIHENSGLYAAAEAWSVRQGEDGRHPR